MIAFGFQGSDWVEMKDLRMECTDHPMYITFKHKKREFRIVGNEINGKLEYVFDTSNICLILDTLSPCVVQRVGKSEPC